jgi:hypothetical protein
MLSRVVLDSWCFPRCRSLPPDVVEIILAVDAKIRVLELEDLLNVNLVPA